MSNQMSNHSIPASDKPIPEFLHGLFSQEIQFKCELEKYYKIKNQKSNCFHIKNLILYYQEDKGGYMTKEERLRFVSTQNNIPLVEKDLVWYKIDGCEICINSKLGCLFCGGYFENFRVFKNGSDITNIYDWSTKKLDPDRDLWKDEDEDYEEDLDRSPDLVSFETK